MRIKRLLFIVFLHLNLNAQVSQSSLSLEGIERLNVFISNKTYKLYFCPKGKDVIFEVEGPGIIYLYVWSLIPGEDFRAIISSTLTVTVENFSFHEFEISSRKTDSYSYTEPVYYLSERWKTSIPVPSGRRKITLRYDEKFSPGMVFTLVFSKSETVEEFRKIREREVREKKKAELTFEPFIGFIHGYDFGNGYLRAPLYGFSFSVLPLPESNSIGMKVGTSYYTISSSKEYYLYNIHHRLNNLSFSGGIEYFFKAGAKGRISFSISALFSKISFGVFYSGEGVYSGFKVNKWSPGILGELKFSYRLGPGFIEVLTQGSSVKLSDERIKDGNGGGIFLGTSYSFMLEI